MSKSCGTLMTPRYRSTSGMLLGETTQVCQESFFGNNACRIGKRKLFRNQLVTTRSRVASFSVGVYSFPSTGGWIFQQRK